MESIKLAKLNSKESEILPETKMPDNLKVCIENIIKNNSYVSYSVNIKDMSTTGDNFLGELFGVDVTGETVDAGKNTSIFVKQTIPENQINLFSISEVYDNEVFAYTDLFNVIDEVQNDANIPESERFKTVKAYDESNSQMIILENLAVKGYRTLPRMDVIPLKFAELSIGQLARFHGMTFALQKLRPKYFESRLRSKKHPFKASYLQEVIDKSAPLALCVLDGEAKKKVNDYLSGITDKYSRYLSKDFSTVTCLCHGDYKVNNILYREMNGDIADVIAVDYQLIHNSNPINDFMYLIFSGTDREFREKHLKTLKDLYFKTMTTFLDNFDIDVENVYPRKVFEEDFRKRIEFGLIISLFFVPFFFVKEDDFPNISNQTFADGKISVDRRFNKRIQGIVDDFIEWGYL